MVVEPQDAGPQQRVAEVEAVVDVERGVGAVRRDDEAVEVALPVARAVDGQVRVVLAVALELGVEVLRPLADLEVGRVLPRVVALGLVHRGDAEVAREGRAVRRR